MTFGELLNSYIGTIGCTAKELAESAGLSAPTLSRYRTGGRTPSEQDDTIRRLAEALSSLAEERKLDGDYSVESIENNLVASIERVDSSAESLMSNLNALVSSLDITVSRLAKYTNYDASFISRVRQGRRSPAESTEFAHAVAGYIVNDFQTESGRAIVSELVGCEKMDLVDDEVFQRTVELWLCNGNTPGKDSIRNFLQKIDEFDLNEYIRAIRFDEMKVPSVPFQLPTSKSYYGIADMMESEIDFLKATVLSKSMDSVIMYSDMPMGEMSKDPEFPKKWMYGMAMMLKKGLRFEMVHNVDRPFDEMMLGLESWIPMYMTGQVVPHYLKGVQNNVFLHLLKVSGGVALSGEAIAGSHKHGRYYLTKSREEVAYYRKRAECLLDKAYPLMNVYRSDSEGAFRAMYINSSKETGKLRSILTAPPLFTATEDFLERVLGGKELTDEERKRIMNHAKEQRDFMEDWLREGTVQDEIAEMSREEFEKHPISLSLSSMFFDRDVQYTYAEYLEHVALVREFAWSHANYSYKANPHQAFRNIQIIIREGNGVLVSKSNSPAIHFVIRHPKMCSAIENMVVPVVE